VRSRRGTHFRGRGTVPNYGEEVIRMRRLGTVPDRKVTFKHEQVATYNRWCR
jgi:hypothetical protein